MNKRERSSLEVQAERAILAAVRLPEDRYDVSDPFGELKALAEQAGAVVVGELTQRLERPVAGTYIGTGKLDELRNLCETLEAGVVIFDHDLSPRQISKIEAAVGRKIVDRSELILDIFAGRATTAEAKLQVELAQLEYTYPRLRAMWDHLERIVGGGGIAGIGTRGPGEMQIEIDRRLVSDRKVRLQRQLEEIQARKRREVAARRAEHFTVGIVGYTNAGKSTLFNTLTSGGAYADDRLFATLMTRTREWEIPGAGGDRADADQPEADATSAPGTDLTADTASSSGTLRVMLSDTVGFVRNLPHNLIASFKATLEEATHADILLLVLDVSDPAAELHYDTVTTTLDELLAGMLESRHDEDREVPPPKRILVLNKADRLKDNASLLIWQRKHPGAIAVSALPHPTRERAIRKGMDQLVAAVREAAAGHVGEYLITLPLRDARGVQAVESAADVLDRTYTDETVTIRGRVGRRQLEQLVAMGLRPDVRTLDGAAVELPGLRAKPRSGDSPWVRPAPGTADASGTTSSSAEG